MEVWYDGRRVVCGGMEGVTVWQKKVVRCRAKLGVLD